MSSHVGAPPLCRQNSARKQSSVLHWPAASQRFIFVYCLTSKILKNFVSCLALGNYRRLWWEEAQGERLVFFRRNTPAHNACRFLKEKQIPTHDVLQLSFGLTLFHSMACQFLQRKSAGILMANNLNL